MPLHLLGKKSWNVYNPANIERVRHDEAEAKKREEELEAKERRDEAETRRRLLKGNLSQGQGQSHGRPLSPPREHSLEREASSQSGHRRERVQKRKLPGEDDTDRDIRLARVASQLAPTSTSPSAAKKPRAGKEDSIVDANGNIALVVPRPEDSNETSRPKQPRPEEDHHTVYLSHAAGRGKHSGEKPWYNSTPKPLEDDNTPANVQWGDGSSRQHERRAARLAANDPLAAMKTGVKQLREAERHRREWMDQRERDLREVEDLAREQRRRDKARKEDRMTRRRSGAKDEESESLDGFDLDQGYPKSRDREHHHRHRHRHHHRRRPERTESAGDYKSEAVDRARDSRHEDDRGHGRSHW